MHNSPEHNLAFKIQFSRTNILYLSHNPSDDDLKLIEWHRQKIKEAEIELKKLKTNS